MNSGDETLLLPLKKVGIKSELRGAFATTSVELIYVNPSKKNPLECQFMFPLEKTSTLVKFEAKIEDTVISTKVIDK